MATSESRSPFRLPWSSDRSHEDPDQFEPVAAATEAAVDEADPAVTSWSDADSPAEPGPSPADPQPPDPVAVADEPGAEEPAVTAWAAVPAPMAPRKPTKLMADLATAIRATTEAARDHALAAVEVEATDVTGAIRAASTEGVEALRRRSDEDLAGIKEWSKAEIARIREETEARIGDRKATLATELAAYASAVEHRIGEVDGAVARYRADMDAYFESLTREEDPSRLATMAEAMPEPLVLDGWRDISDLDLSAFVPVPVAAPEPEAVVEPFEPEAVAAEAVVETFEPEAVAAEAVVETFEPEAVAAEAVVETFEPEAVAAEAVVETFGPEAAVETLEPEATVETLEPETEMAEPDTFAPEPEAVAADVETLAPEAVVESVVESVETETFAPELANTARPNPWGATDDGWSAGAVTRTATATAATYEYAVPVAAESGDSVDRATIMAALEAAAEAVVAAETAAGSTDQLADPAADEVDFESQSFADRLASLIPSRVEVADGGEPRTTQVVVTGLVSVASIASFKRHLGRLAGVQAVGVASGPGGEFVFNVTHSPDVSFRDVIPSMPGFRRARDRHRRRRRVRRRARSRGGGLTLMASTTRRPAIAILLPTAEAGPVIAELRTGGFEPILVSDLAELAALVAVRRDVAVAVLDVEGEADGGASTWTVLHEFGRNIPALLVVNPVTLDRLDTSAPGHDNDEYLTRPYSAESIRWRIEAMVHPIRRRRRRQRARPPGRPRGGQLEPAWPADRRVQPQGRRRQDHDRDEPGRRAHGTRAVRAPGGCRHGHRSRAHLAGHGRRPHGRRRLARRARGRPRPDFRRARLGAPVGPPDPLAHVQPDPHRDPRGGSGRDQPRRLAPDAWTS